MTERESENSVTVGFGAKISVFDNNTDGRHSETDHMNKFEALLYYFRPNKNVLCSCV